ncbi:hypothetical protein PCAR4_430032 [Paraburkholderia caribensis]|nr:hypothetical protein PCAR4_430032 [Paraburkholderia caribensis]
MSSRVQAVVRVVPVAAAVSVPATPASRCRRCMPWRRSITRRRRASSAIAWVAGYVQFYAERASSSSGTMLERRVTIAIVCVAIVKREATKEMRNERGRKCRKMRVMHRGDAHMHRRAAECAASDALRITCDRSMT